MAFSIKVGDTLPRLTATLTDGNDDPLDVSGADAVTFRMRKEDGQVGSRTVDKAVEFTTDGSDGKVEVEFTAEETALDGRYIGEFVIDWDTDEIQTVPSDDYVRVTIVKVI